MQTAYGASLDSLESAFIPIELTAISHGYLVRPTTAADRAAAVLAAELLSRVCAIDSLENSSQLSTPARDALHAIFLVASGTPVEIPSHAEVSSSPKSLRAAEQVMRSVQHGPLASYLPGICELAYTCLVHGSADSRIAAAADALLPYVGDEF